MTAFLCDVRRTKLSLLVAGSSFTKTYFLCNILIIESSWMSKYQNYLNRVFCFDLLLNRGDRFRSGVLGVNNNDVFESQVY